MITPQQQITLQAEDWFGITPSDTINFVGDTEKNPRGYTHAAIFVGTGGDIALVSESGSREIFKNIPNGWFLPCKCVRVHFTGTTAQNIIGIIQQSELDVK